MYDRVRSLVTGVFFFFPLQKSLVMPSDWRVRFCEALLDRKSTI